MADATPTPTVLLPESGVQRIVADLAAHQPKFTVVTLVGDEMFASLTWNAERLTTGERLCGIEIFEVHDGVITDVWNPDYLEGSP